MKDPNENFLKTFEFKGIEIEPLSYMRKTCLLTIVDLSAPEFLDIPRFLYGAICNPKELQRAVEKSNRPAFTASVLKWAESINYTLEDAEPAATIIKALLDNSEADKAQPMEDASLAPDPNS
jgi:hypothetical protein